MEDVSGPIYTYTKAPIFRILTDPFVGQSGHYNRYSWQLGYLKTWSKWAKFYFRIRIYFNQIRHLACKIFRSFSNLNGRHWFYLLVNVFIVYTALQCTQHKAPGCRRENVCFSTLLIWRLYSRFIVIFVFLFEEGLYCKLVIHYTVHKIKRQADRKVGKIYIKIVFRSLRIEHVPCNHAWLYISICTVHCTE